MRHRSRSFSRDDSGAMMVLGGILMVVLLGFAALAIDIGHLCVVKNELQNAADAGSMAGANNLAPYLPTNPPTPDFDSAETVAREATNANQTDYTLITDPVVDVGYYNLGTKVLQPRTISPTILDVAAVKVKVSRVAGENGGAVLPFIARVLGIDFMNVSAQATSMLSCPSVAPPGSLLPVAINQQVLPYLWNTTDPNDTNLSQPFNIGSDYHYPDISEGGDIVAGEWTSFFDVANDSSTIKDLINNGNPDSIALEQKIQCLDPTYVQPGTKTDIYTVLKSKMQSNPANYIYYLPVVKLDSLDTHSFDPVKCWIPVILLESVGNYQKYIRAQFVKRAHNNWNSAGGPCYGTFGTPKVVQ
jgi:Flp pilus assembly protein TadG